jgi:hypothetical protein
VSEELQPQLAAVLAEYDAVTQAVRALAAGVDDVTFARKPSPDRWSAAECVEHLTLSNRLYYDMIRDGLAQARLMPPHPGPHRRRWLGRLLAWSLEPGHGGKSRTIPATVPRVAVGTKGVVGDYIESQHVIASFVRESSGLDLRRIVITSPFLKYLKYDLYSLYTIIAAHGRRHLAQAQRAVRGE